ncbi:hypothetical protein FSP39_014824, partial [Pinctada imbricata]
HDHHSRDSDRHRRHKDHKDKSRDKDRDKSRHKDKRDKDDTSKLSQEELEIKEANELRAKLGLPPLK